MNAPCFADTVFWIGLSRRRDQHHARAVQWQEWPDRHQVKIVTSELVLWEWLNAFADPALRTIAAQGCRRCRTSDLIQVMTVSTSHMEAALRFYESHQDKAWSLTDCYSFIIMRERGLFAALTTDQHFVQAGFQALMLAEPSD